MSGTISKDNDMEPASFQWEFETHMVVGNTNLE